MRSLLSSRTRPSHRDALPALALVVALLSACGAAEGALDGPLGGGPPAGEKGVVSGRVTDGKGRPIAGATIVINNTTWFNRNIVLTSDANGYYRTVMPPTDA